MTNWEARKQQCTALSTTEAEYVAIAEVCKDICFVRNFLLEILSKSFNVIVYNDNQSALKLLSAKEHCHRKTKHIDLRYHFVRDLISESLCVRYLSTNEMLADVLTKSLSSVKHCNFVNGLNLKKKIELN